MSTVLDRGPFMATQTERSALEELEQALTQSRACRPMVVDRMGRQIEIPDTATRLFRTVVRALARGQAVAVVPLQRELTTQQAANLLNVSRPYLVRLLDEGRIPSTKTGTHRRVRFEDVMDYKERRDAEREEGLTRLARMS